MLDVVDTVTVLSLLREAKVGVLRAKDANGRHHGQAACRLFLIGVEMKLDKLLHILTDSVKDEGIWWDKNPS